MMFHTLLHKIICSVDLSRNNPTDISKLGKIANT